MNRQRIEGDLEVGGSGGGNVTIDVTRSPPNVGFRFGTFPKSGLTVESGNAVKLQSVAEIQLAPADQKPVVLATTGTLPAASAAFRGALFVVRGATGVADTLQVCLKSSADSYSWKVLATG